MSTTLAGTPTADKLDRRIAADILAHYHDLRGAAADGARIARVVNGYGTHYHGATCRAGCMNDCDNSDYVVTLDYGTDGYQAVYGVYRGRFSLWAD